MTNPGLKRWYRDGWLARQNGKPRSTNPKAVNGYVPGATWNSKAELWDHGWLAADEGLNALREWDAEQDIINELKEELS